MIYQHPLAYLLGMEGLALLRAWAGDEDFDERFVHERLQATRALLDDPELSAHPGVLVERGATAAAYAQWAATYDHEDNGLFDLDEPLIDAIVADLPRGRAIDAGCGTGRLALRLACLGFRVTGIDGSPAMLERARLRTADVDFVLGDLDALPAADGTADVVVTGLALTHVDDLTGVYAEFARVLRPGGDLVVADVHEDLVFLGSAVKGVAAGGRPALASTTRHSTADHLIAALAAGFTVVGYQEAPRPSTSTSTGTDPEAEPEPLPEPTREIGEWRLWPWTLLGVDPAASRAAWHHPAIMVWHLRRAD